MRLFIIMGICAFPAVALAQTPTGITQIPQDQLAKMRTACDLVCTRVWNGAVRGQSISNEKWSCDGDNASACSAVIVEFKRRQDEAYSAAAQATLSNMLKDNGLK